jgi:hypothetical protein
LIISFYEKDSAFSKALFFYAEKNRIFDFSSLEKLNQLNKKLRKTLLTPVNLPMVFNQKNNLRKNTAFSSGITV